MTFFRWRFPNGTPGNVAWRFRTRKECEKHYRGFKGEAVKVEEIEVKKKVVKTFWLTRCEGLTYWLSEFAPDINAGDGVRLTAHNAEAIFGVRLKPNSKPVEYRLERVIRKRGKFAKRPAKARRKKAK